MKENEETQANAPAMRYEQLRLQLFIRVLANAQKLEQPAMKILASLLLVVRPGAPSSFLFLVVMPGAPSSVLARMDWT